MQRKVATNFRLYPETLERIDKLITDQPQWLNECGLGKVADRTEVVERLVYLAMQKWHASNASDDTPSTKPAIQSATARPQKAKTARKR